MKKSIKAISMIAVLTFSLTGCAYNNTVNEVNSALVETTSNEENSTSEATEPTSEETSSTTKETTSSSTIEEKPTTSTTATSTSSTVTKPTEKPAVSSSSSSKPVSSSSKPTSTTTKPVSSSTSSSSTNKPVSSSSKPVSSTTKPTSSTTKPTSSTSKPTSSTTSSSTNKPTEKPTHTHNFTNATCTTPATCKICGVTKGTVANHNYKDGHCTYCGKSDPNYVAPHDCKNDGHIWSKSYTETSTENVEIVETHDVCANGYDYTLATEKFGVEYGTSLNFKPYLGTNAFGSGSSKVKTTGIKTITRYIHECSECGYKEVYNTEETVTPGDIWVFVNKPRSEYFPIIWYDINNIPDEVYEGVEKEQEAINKWLNTF